MPAPPPLKCPKCDGQDLRPHGRRYPLYPLGPVVFLSVVVAIFHQASLPLEFTCRQCGTGITRRSRGAGCAFAIFAAGLAFVLLGYLLRVAFLFLIATG